MYIVYISLIDKCELMTFILYACIVSKVNDWLIHTSDNSICYLCSNNKKYYIIFKVLKSGIFPVLYY